MIVVESIICHYRVSLVILLTLLQDIYFKITSLKWRVRCIPGHFQHNIVSIDYRVSFHAARDYVVIQYGFQVLFLIGNVFNYSMCQSMRYVMRHMPGMAYHKKRMIFLFNISVPILISRKLISNKYQSHYIK